MPSPKLILASSSPARKTLLERLKIPFSTLSPDADETPLPNESTPETVLRLAKLKADICAATFSDALIIGADQLGTVENTLLGKPLTLEKAKQQLSFISGKCVRFYTGLCLLDAKENIAMTAVEIFDVYFRHLTSKEIDTYLQKEKPFECAGSFQIEGLGISLVERLSGDDYTSLIGLPLIRLSDMLRSFSSKYAFEF